MWSMQVKVLGIERRRWSRDQKARIVEETMAPGSVVCEVARRYGVSPSLTSPAQAGVCSLKIRRRLGTPTTRCSAAISAMANC